MARDLKTLALLAATLLCGSAGAQQSLPDPTRPPAGLQAAGTTEVVEPAASRDHTERMLAALGAPITRVDDRAVRVTAGAPSR